MTANSAAAGLPVKSTLVGLIALLRPRQWVKNAFEVSRGIMFFEVIGQIQNIETFAYGSAIREIGRLRRQYGIANWRKRKGIATVRLSDGTIRLAEVHWYEATGIGKLEIKIKCYLD